MQRQHREKMKPFAPEYWTTVVGSFPNTNSRALCQRLLEGLDVPDWPQLPRRSFRESMYVQYSAMLPALVIDEAGEKVYFDTSGDWTGALERFYEHYLADEVDAFALSPEYAQGFFEMLTIAAGSSLKQGWIKGQVTGPVSFGLTVTDQDLRASLYNEMLADVIIKNMAMNARWQVRQLKKVTPNVIIFVDEPYMASFGSAFISLSREQAVGMLNEVFAAIQAEGALAGVHCCANTDWSVLLETEVDILNLDAYGFLENLALYPQELRHFLDRGGTVAWGIVPNNAEVETVQARDLAVKLREGLEEISRKALARGVSITPEEFDRRSLIAPSCGLGSTTTVVAERVLDMLAQVGESLQAGR
jgi:methionine synthase II (cobalamin-independent)